MACALDGQPPREPLQWFFGLKYLSPVGLNWKCLTWTARCSGLSVGQMVPEPKVIVDLLLRMPCVALCERWQWEAGWSRRCWGALLEAGINMRCSRMGGQLSQVKEVVG